MRKQLQILMILTLLAAIVLTACSGGNTPGPGTNGKTQVRWFVGLGTGTNPEQIAAQEQVVADFNGSQSDIELVREVVPCNAAYDTLATQISSGAGPDIVGPVGWGGSAAFYGQWLDMTPYIQDSGFDTSIFDPALVAFYQTEEGQVGLPFAVFPAAWICPCTGPANLRTARPSSRPIRD